MKRKRGFWMLASKALLATTAAVLMIMEARAQGGESQPRPAGHRIPRRAVLWIDMGGCTLPPIALQRSFSEMPRRAFGAVWPPCAKAPL